MSGTASVEVVHSADAQTTPTRSAPEVQRLWFALDRRSWRSLALVPADPVGSCSGLARALAEAGRELTAANVTAIALESITAAQLACPGGDPGSDTASHAARHIVALPSVLREPLGVGMACQADAVVLAIELGRTSAEDARRTIELIGRERILGCLIVR